MSVTIHISPDTYQLLRRRAEQMRSTPEAMAETAIRLQLGHTAHIEQRPTPFGPQAYVRGTRVAVRHVAAFVHAGYSAEAISRDCLPDAPPAAVYEAIAYYYDHQAEIEAELEANAPEAVANQLRQRLSPEQYARLSGQTT